MLASALPTCSLVLGLVCDTVPVMWGLVWPGVRNFEILQRTPGLPGKAALDPPQMLVPPTAPPPLKGPSVSAPRVVGTLPMGVGSAFHPSPFWLKPSEHRLQHRASSTEPPATDSAAMHSPSQSSRTPIPVPTPEPTPDGIFGRTPTPPPPPGQTPELFGGKGGSFVCGKGGCFDGGKGDKSGKPTLSPEAIAMQQMMRGIHF